MPPAPNCSAPSHGIGPRSRDPPSGLARPEGMGARPLRSPRFPPPAHRRFTVRGDRARGQPVENAPRPIRHCASCRPRARRCTAASIAPSSGLLDNIPNPAPTASSGEFRLMSVWDQTIVARRRHGSELREARLRTWRSDRDGGAAEGDGSPTERKKAYSVRRHARTRGATHWG